MTTMDAQQKVAAAKLFAFSSIDHKDEFEEVSARFDC